MCFSYTIHSTLLDSGLLQSQDIFIWHYVYFVSMHEKLIFYILSLAITVMFSQTTYNVDEYDGSAQPTLVLSNPSATTITVQVINIDGSATGEYCSILINY